MSTPFHRAAVHLRHAASVVVCAHVRPDGDAIGSTLAATLALRQAGIPAVPTLADDEPPPRLYSFLPGFGLYVPLKDLDQPEVFLALDTPDFARLGDAEGMARASETVIVVDHHPDNKEFGTVNVVDTRAAATGQLIWHLAQRLEIAPSPEFALCCYVALMTDTGRFAYQNTTADTLSAAADMLEAGVDAAEASRLIYQERSAEELYLEALVLKRLTLANGGRVAYSWYTAEDLLHAGMSQENTERLPDVVRQIEGVDVALLFRVSGTETRVNLRAKTGFDVGAVARRFEGGGHAAAAGLTFQGDHEAALRDLLPMLPGADSQ